MTRSVWERFSWEKVNSHKKFEEKLKGLKTNPVFPNTRFSRLKWVANKSSGLAAKTLKDKIVKNFLSVFRTGRSTREGVVSWAAKISEYPSRLDLSLVNKSPKLTRELVVEACDLDDLRLSRQNRATLFLKFFSFCKNKIFSKNTKNTQKSFCVWINKDWASENTF